MRLRVVNHASPSSHSCVCISSLYLLDFVTRPSSLRHTCPPQAETTRARSASAEAERVRAAQAAGACSTRSSSTCEREVEGRREGADVKGWA
eukprot:5494639-Pleurochrysis_carterae.AAC.1